MATTFRATWSKSLRWMSVGSTILMAGISIPLLRSPTPWAVLLVWAILLGALPFVVRGYVVDGRTLRIRRLWWDTRIDLSGLVSAEVKDCQAFKGTWRVCGNGGLFSFTGWYRNKELGLFRLYANSFTHPVIIRLPSRTLVVSPDDPQPFVELLHASTHNPPA